MLILVNSCTKHNEVPSPISAQTQTETIHKFQQEFQQNHYDQRLAQALRGNSSNPAWTWSSDWSKTSVQQVGDSVTYAYIPLIPSLSGSKQSVILLGVRKYILVKQNQQSIQFGIIDYLWNAPSTIPVKNDLPSNFFATFSGQIQIQNLVNEKRIYLNYQNGALQKSPTNSGKAHHTLSANDVACYTYYTCYWTLFCRSYNGESPNGGPQPYVYGRMTHGIGYCAQPSYNPSDPATTDSDNCAWQKTDQQTNMVCGDPSGPDPNPQNPTPGPGPNPNDPNYPTTPTTHTPNYNPTSEYIDPNYTYTAAPPPPDVTEYKCAQLRNTHPDDSYQGGHISTIDDFFFSNANTSRDDIIAQRGFQPILGGMMSLAQGPYTRYIYDPLIPGTVIDLRHMLVVAFYGPTVGNSVEIFQSIGQQPSAYDHQDYFSNQLGYDFYNTYGASIKANPTLLAYYLEQFLKDSNQRTHNTAPDLIKLQCP